ncbi:MAG: hypothetical protein GX811_04695, partial [Lentisphaerae bacterium]|nr:hypothetical protein [Lentisphaerota bacterium]
LLFSWAHGIVVRGRWAKFARVYAHVGMLIINLALWFLSFFGYYEDYNSYWRDSESERLLYSLLWGLVSGGSLLAGAKYGIKMLRGYGMTFLIINLYTFYFQFIVYHSGAAWFMHLLLTGGSLLWLGRYFESKRVSDVQAPLEQSEE